jgi:hypothetical protein
MKPAASVHRFRDLVAVRTGNGQTVYLSPKAAAELSAALSRAAGSIEATPYDETAFAPVDILDGSNWHSSNRSH